MSKSLLVALHFCSMDRPVGLQSWADLLNYLYVKKSAGGPPFLQYGPAYWAAKLGREVGLCGLVWRVSRFVNESEGHQQTLTLVCKPMVL
jgi:hypothetical protein